MPLQFESYKNVCLVERGAVQSALAETELRKILTAYSKALLQELPSSTFKIQISKGDIVPVRKQVSLRFTRAGKISEKPFMVLTTMGNIFNGMIFLRKYSVTIDINDHLLHFPDLSLQFKHANGKYKCKMCEL